MKTSQRFSREKITVEQREEINKSRLSGEQRGDKCDKNKIAAQKN